MSSPSSTASPSHRALQSNSSNPNPNMLASLQQTFETILPTNNDNLKFLSGTLAFYTTCLLSQTIQFKFLHMSTGTRPGILPLMAGALTVGVGSCAGHLAGMAVSGDSEKAVRPVKLLLRRDEGLTRPETRERREFLVRVARICLLGLLTYKTILRSHFTSLSPSSYTAPGSFARIGIPAPPNFNYATSSQRDLLERLGRRWGCHTCGSRMFFSNIAKGPRFHGDHIPPVSVAKQWNEVWYRRRFGWKVGQMFYPKCRDCSGRQGGLLGRAIRAGHGDLRVVGGGRESYFHGWRLRIGHLTGGVLGVVGVGSGEEDLVRSGRERVCAIRDWFLDCGGVVMNRVHGLWK